MISTGNYLVFVCRRCGSVRYAKEEQKTAKCFKCGFQIPLNLHTTRILLRTGKMEEAIEAVKRYKVKFGSRGLV